MTGCHRIVVTGSNHHGYQEHQLALVDVEPSSGTSGPDLLTGYVCDGADGGLTGEISKKARSC